MNNDDPISPSAAADPQLSASLDATSPSLSDTTGGSSTARKTLISRTNKTLTHLSSLLYSLDTTIFIQLSILYYLDSRLILFLFRALIQIFVLSPRVPSAFQPPTPAADVITSPVIGAIFSANLICVLVHLISDGPRAGEITQFYNHGGIFVDFIGEKTPISKFRLLALDILVCVLELTTLGGLIEKARLKKILDGPTATSDSTTPLPGSSGPTPLPTEPNPSNLQDHDAEERGLASDPLMSTTMEELEQEPPSNSPHSHPLDSFTTGTHLIADLNLTATVRRQWRVWKMGLPAGSVPTSTSAPGAGTLGSVMGAPVQGQGATFLGPFGLTVRMGGRVVND